MTALFGSYWAYFVVPTMLGFSVLLVVLALKPPRKVAILTGAFVVVCAMIGVGMTIDARIEAERAAAMIKCFDSTPGGYAAKSKQCGGPKAFIGNEMYRN